MDFYTELCGLLVGAWAFGFGSGLITAVIFAAVRLITFR
jgi:hypothetical protein